MTAILAYTTQFLFVLILFGFSLETGLFHIAQIVLKTVAILLFQPPESWVHHARTLSFCALFIASDAAAELTVFL